MDRWVWVWVWVTCVRWRCGVADSCDGAVCILPPEEQDGPCKARVGRVSVRPGSVLSLVGDDEAVVQTRRVTGCGTRWVTLSVPFVCVSQGGYFVINGSEKVLIAQERQAYNRVYCFKRKAPSKSTWTCEIRSDVSVLQCCVALRFTVMYLRVWSASVASVCLLTVVCGFSRPQVMSSNRPLSYFELQMLRKGGEAQGKQGNQIQARIHSILRSAPLSCSVWVVGVTVSTRHTDGVVLSGLARVVV